MSRSVVPFNGPDTDRDDLYNYDRKIFHRGAKVREIVTKYRNYNNIIEKLYLAGTSESLFGMFNLRV